VFVPEEFPMTTGKSHGPAGLAEPEVQHAEVNSRRSVFCFGPLDLRTQAEVRSALRTDRPKELAAKGQACPHMAIDVPRDGSLAVRAAELDFGPPCTLVTLDSGTVTAGV
jgi:hypothetical protein